MQQQRLVYRPGSTRFENISGTSTERGVGDVEWKHDRDSISSRREGRGVKEDIKETTDRDEKQEDKDNYVNKLVLKRRRGYEER
ncbi:hypothetical protein E2C01_093007 [Portunus trituberculatus]|uniref:Uncharacterized protein n=1 Tax=Portunus trituberculatus TaxID=210409 RepID=A0A5B7JNP8_PORTR|nr:hypothetical protein [Portunus trituberculatus]